MPRALESLRVLIVDDEFHIRKIVKAVLQSMNIRDVTEATNGKDAYEQLRIPRALHGEKARRFDFVICDWMMPEMTGIEFLEKVRGERFFEKLPVLMLTAENDTNKVMKAIGQGVNDYVIKPFTAQILEEKLRKVIAKIPED